MKSMWGQDDLIDMNTVTGRSGQAYRGRYHYYVELESLMTDEPLSNSDKLAIVAWHITNCKGSWAWKVSNHAVYGGDDNSTLFDIRPWLIISFDLSDDAMLSRMTWEDMKRYPNDNSRGCP